MSKLCVVLPIRFFIMLYVWMEYTPENEAVLCCILSLPDMSCPVNSHFVPPGVFTSTPRRSSGPHAAVLSLQEESVEGVSRVRVACWTAAPALERVSCLVSRSVIQPPKVSEAACSRHRRGPFY